MHLIMAKDSYCYLDRPMIFRPPRRLPRNAGEHQGRKWLAGSAAFTFKVSVPLAPHGRHIVHLSGIEVLIACVFYHVAI
jgi:hypothetical protein